MWRKTKEAMIQRPYYENMLRARLTEERLLDGSDRLSRCFASIVAIVSMPITIPFNIINNYEKRKTIV